MIAWCDVCHQPVAREDFVRRDDEVYHRQCAPDGGSETDD